ncbi:MAG TPA: WD40 repeat domain-containing protein [Pyrinomonadaceae bacterium]|nr:WD40 repeat domain-containing protein [Pyrinomonadaceae bacterium]
MKYKPRKVKLPNRTVIHTLDINPAGDQLVVGQDSPKNHSYLTLWSAPDLKLISELEHEKHELLKMARFTSDGKKIAYVDSTLTPRIYDLEEKKSSPLNLKNPVVQWLAPASKGDQLVVAGALTQVWDASAEKVVWKLPGQVASKNRESIPAIAALHPNGKQIAVAGVEKGAIRIYDLKQDEPVKSLQDAPDQARWISFDPHGRYLAAIELNSHGTFVWNVRSGKQILPDVFGAEFESYWCLRFHPNGKYLALGMLSGYVVVVRLADGEFLLDEKQHKGRVWDLVFTPDGKHLISGGDDATLFLWELNLD